MLMKESRKKITQQFINNSAHKARKKRKQLLKAELSELTPSSPSPPNRNKDPKMPGEWGKHRRNKYPFPKHGMKWCWLSCRGKWSFHRGVPAGGKPLVALWCHPLSKADKELGWILWGAFSAQLSSLRPGAGAGCCISTSPTRPSPSQQLFTSPQGS